MSKTFTVTEYQGICKVNDVFDYEDVELVLAHVVAVRDVRTMNAPKESSCEQYWTFKVWLSNGSCIDAFSYKSRTDAINIRNALIAALNV